MLSTHRSAGTEPTPNQRIGLKSRRFKARMKSGFRLFVIWRNRSLAAGVFSARAVPALHGHAADLDPTAQKDHRLGSVAKATGRVYCQRSPIITPGRLYGDTETWMPMRMASAQPMVGFYISPLARQRHPPLKPFLIHQYKQLHVAPLTWLVTTL